MAKKKIKAEKKMEAIKIEPKIIEVVKAPKKKMRESDLRDAFRTYFIQLKRKINLKPDLEEIMWLHFKASGFDDIEKFDEGTRHFGYKI